MDRFKIEFILTMRPPVVEDPYVHQVADILKMPSVLHPIKRRRFKKQFVNRVQLVLTEHTVNILNNIGDAEK